MSLFFFYMPSLAQALKSSSIYELNIGLYAYLQFYFLNLAQYTSLVLFYIHSYSPSFEIQLNIRVQYWAICLALALALKLSQYMSLFMFYMPSLAQALKSSSIYEFILVLYAQIQLQHKNLAQYMCLDLFSMTNFNPSFKIQLNIRVLYWSICLALALTFKSSSIYEFSLVLYAQL